MKSRPAVVAALAAIGVCGCRSPQPASLDQMVRARLDSLEAQTSMYAKHLATGREVAVRDDQPKNTLSVIKLAIMVLAYRDADAGRLRLDQRYLVGPKDLRRGSGLIQTFAPGLAPTYRDLITQMIITSDNTATDIMIARLGRDRVNQMLQDLGYHETRLRTTTGGLFRAVWERADPAWAKLTDRQVFERGFPNDSGAQERSFALEGDSTQWLGRTTAREISRLLEQLYRGELASKASTDEMLGILRRQFYASRLPRYIGLRIPIGHKTGDWPPFAGNDVGILFTPRGPIVVAVFATQNRGSFVTLEETIGRIAEDLMTAWGTPAGSNGQ